MATTFKIINNDVVLSNVSGRPNLIGNVINENVLSKAKNKTSQDMRRSLSINRIRNGTGAGINELIGTTRDLSQTLSARILLQRQILNMFRSLIRQQNIRPNVRPNNEKFNKITLFRILPETGTKTAFRFRLDVTTEGGGVIIESGIIG